MQINALCHHTDTHVLFFATRGNAGDFLVPMVWSTDDRLEQYFQLTFGMKTRRFAGRLELFVLAGLPGAQSSALEDLASLKTKTSSLIFSQLRK